MKSALLNILIILIIFPVTELYSRALDTVWTRTYGGAADDEAYSVVINSANDIAVAGYTSSFGAGQEDIYFLNINSNGDTIYSRTYGSAYSESSYGLIPVPGDGYALIGHAGYYPLASTVYLLRIDTSGNQLWTRTFRGARGSWIDNDWNGGFIISGNYLNDWFDFNLIRTDSCGILIWSDTIDIELNDYCTAGVLPEQGGYVFVGCVGSGVSDNSWDLYIIRMDEENSILWTRRYGSPGDDFPNSVIQAADGAFIIVGYTRINDVRGNDVWLVKINDEGDTIWTRTYGGFGEDFGSSMLQVDDGGFLIVGATGSFGGGGKDVYIIRTDSYGDTLWTKTVGGSDNDIGRQICEISNNNYIIVGYTESSGAGGRDVYLIKLGPDPAGIDIDKEPLPQSIRLHQNYPNPFNQSTLISFDLAEARFISLKIYDLLGREAGTLIEELKPAGSYNVLFDGSDLANGVYIYRLHAGKHSDFRKLVLLK